MGIKDFDDTPKGEKKRKATTWINPPHSKYHDHSQILVDLSQRTIKCRKCGILWTLKSKIYSVNLPRIERFKTIHQKN
jgi:hypothetical protein